MKSKILWCFLVLAISEIASETTISRNPKDFWKIKIERPKMDFVEDFKIYHRPTNYSEWKVTEVPAYDHSYTFDGIHCGPNHQVHVEVHNSLASETPNLSMEITVKAPEGKDDCLLTHATTIMRKGENKIMKTESAGEAYVGAILSMPRGSPENYRDFAYQVGSASNVREFKFEFRQPE